MSDSGGSSPGLPTVITSLAPRRLAASPGDEAFCELRLFSTVADELTLELKGTPGPWASVEPWRVPIGAGGRAVARLAFNPPTSVTAPGPMSFGVKVESRANPGAYVLEQGLLVLSPPTETSTPPVEGAPAPTSAGSGPPPSPEGPAPKSTSRLEFAGSILGLLAAILGIVQILYESDIGPFRGRSPMEVVGEVFTQTDPPADQTTVPSVLGITVEQAREVIAGNDLAVAEEPRFDASVPTGDVIATEPSAGSRVDRGSTVRVIVSQGPETFSDLSLLIIPSAGTGSPGSPLSYKVEVTNNGPDAATNARITGSITGAPFSVLGQPFASSGICSFEAGNGQFHCNFDDLAPGGVDNMTIDLVPAAPGAITIEASAESDQSDPDPGNNSGSLSTPIT